MSVREQKKTSKFRNWLRGIYQNFQHRLAHSDALPQLAILGCISGLTTGVIAILFRLSFELPLKALLSGDNTETFELLSPYFHFLLPLTGLVLVGLILKNIEPQHQVTGVGHVVDRVHQHQGRFPVKNALIQFFCGSLLLSSGTPIGREGPAVHLGAATSSQLGEAFGLPNNSLRVLAGCGVAAAIGASFNTPLAGVIFAMEVVLMEYTIVGFLPIILAAVSGTFISHLVYGDTHAFSVPTMKMSSLIELPYLIFSGLVIGAIAALALPLYTFCSRLKSDYSVMQRAWAIGLFTGVLCLLLPQIQGLGYDLIEHAMLGKIGAVLLMLLGILRLMAASAIVGLGFPGGMVSPTLVSGSCIGGALGILGISMFPGYAADTGFYAMLGMGAMMGAVLNAPLAGLLALLELTSNPQILMPAMLVIAVATITARMLSKLPGIFLINRNPKHLASPVHQMLSRAGVISLMNKNTLCIDTAVSLADAELILERKLDWLVIVREKQPKELMRPVDLAHYLAENDTVEWGEEYLIKLKNVPGSKQQLMAISSRASLAEAHQLMQNKNITAIYVTPNRPISSTDITGIITIEDINNYYH
jgi:CIC family chloride channel protein